MANEGEVTLVKGPSWLQDRWIINGASWARWMALACTGLISVLTTITVVQSLTPWHLTLGAIIIATSLTDVVDLHLPFYLFAALELTAAFLLIGNDNASFGLFVVLVVLGEASTTCGVRESLAVLATAEGVLLAHAIKAMHYYRPGWISWMVANVLVWAACRAFNRQAQLMTELQQAQAALAEQAMLQERQRIAREIHDVIAHSLTVTMLHLTGARLALEHDPGEAAQALLEAERLGRQSLADIRRTVGVLTPAEGVDALSAPLPGAGDIPALIEQYRTAGLDVRAEITGDPAVVSLATGLGLYRIVQEALANVVKHAPASRTVVTLDIANAVTLRVGSRPSGTSGSDAHSPAGGVPSGHDAPPGGLGIQGMIERAALLGGWLTAAPDGESWLVDARVPLEAASAGRVGMPGEPTKAEADARARVGGL